MCPGSVICECGDWERSQDRKLISKGLGGRGNQGHRLDHQGPNLRSYLRWPTFKGEERLQMKIQKESGTWVREARELVSKRIKWSVALNIRERSCKDEKWPLTFTKNRAWEEVLRNHKHCWVMLSFLSFSSGLGLQVTVETQMKAPQALFQISQSRQAQCRTLVLWPDFPLGRTPAPLH